MSMLQLFEEYKIDTNSVYVEYTTVEQIEEELKKIDSARQQALSEYHDICIKVQGSN